MIGAWNRDGKDKRSSMKYPSSEDDFASNSSLRNLVGGELDTRELNVICSV
jgi:hypothetical protein